MNIKHNNKTNIYFSYLLVFLLIFVSTKASTFSSSIFLTRFVTAALVSFFIFNRLKGERKFVKFAIYFFAFSLIMCFKYNDTHPFFDFLFFFIDIILLVYLTLKIVGPNFFIIYEKIVYKWSLYIFPFFLLQLIMPDSIFKLNKAIGSIFNVVSANLERDNYSNSIFFTMINGVHKERNCGFMWEPGAFGAVLIIAFVIYLYSNKFKFNTKVIAYLVLILSTYSTTAYLNLLLIPFFYLFNSKTNNNIFAGSIIVIAAVIFLNFSSSTVLDKINFQFSNLDNDLIRLDYNLEGTIVLDRFASLVYLFPKIQDNYWIGTGWSFVNEIAQAKTVSLSNGIAYYFVMFGLVGLTFFIYNIYKTGLIFFNSNKKLAILFLIIVINIGFSNPVLLLPFFVSLQLFSYVDFQKKLKT
jgi:hypothetical protein